MFWYEHVCEDDYTKIAHIRSSLKLISSKHFDEGIISTIDYIANFNGIIARMMSVAKVVREIKRHFHNNDESNEKIFIEKETVKLDDIVCHQRRHLQK